MGYLPFGVAPTFCHVLDRMAGFYTIYRNAGDISREIDAGF